MRKTLSLLVVTLVLIFVAPVLAATVTVSGTADSMHHFIYFFGSGAGDVTVTSTFVPQRNKGYTLLVSRDGADVCRVDTSFQGWSHPVLAETQMSCTDPAGPGGTYKVEFYPSKGGSIDFDLTVTTP